jgi:hypothetical protein
MQELQFDAAAIDALGAPIVWLHSIQEDDDTGSVFISLNADGLPPRVYALGCQEGTPLSYINHSVDGYDTLRDEIDLTSILYELPLHRYLNVLFDNSSSPLQTGVILSTSDELGLVYEEVTR